MKETIIGGIDMHDNSLVCRVAVGRGEAETKRYSNSESGRGRCFKDLAAKAAQYGGADIVVAYEASTQGFCFYDDCRDNGIECFILAPTKMRKSKKDMKKKNDENDAQLILETLRGYVLAGNKLPAIWIADDETRADRQTVRARLDLGFKLTGVKTQVRTLLKGNRLSKPDGMGSSWTKPYRSWLKSLCMDRASWPALATLMRQIDSLEREIKIVNEQIETLSLTPRYEAASRALVEQITGVGLLTAMVFLTEMGDLSRFANRQKVGAFLGLVPTSNESGESSDRKGHITREGSARLRRVLCQATWARVRLDPGESTVYKRNVSRNLKRKKIAVVASMRRLGILMWHVGLEAQQKANVFPRKVSTQLDKVA